MKSYANICTLYVSQKYGRENNSGVHYQNDTLMGGPLPSIEFALQKIAQRGLLSEKGIAVYERDRPFEGEVDGLEKYDERKYGKTYITFFRRKTQE